MRDDRNYYELTGGPTDDVPDDDGWEDGWHCLGCDVDNPAGELCACGDGPPTGTTPMDEPNARTGTLF